MSRNQSNGKKLARVCGATFVSDLNMIPTDCDLYLLCVADDAIVRVCQDMPTQILENRLVAHTSGSRPIADLDRSRHRGVFYPLQTFTSKRRMSYGKIPFCLDAADEQSLSALIKLASQISTEVLHMDDQKRQTAHIAAVMINNFVNHLIYKAEKILEMGGVPKKVLQPLLTETIKKQLTIGSFSAQTGPARRGDKGTISKHLSQLDPSDHRLYEAITDSITATYLEKKIVNKLI